MMDPNSLLGTFRGDFPKANLNARRIAGSLEVPGCQRRSVLEAASVDLNKLAKVLTGNDSDRQSPFAIARGHQFEKHVTQNGMAAIVAIVREKLGFDIPESRQNDLSADVIREQYPEIPSGGFNEFRAELTRKSIEEMLYSPNSAINLLRHAMTRIDFGGEPVYLEQDVLAFAVEGKLYVVEIKSFPAIDKRADPKKASQAVRQSAVYVLSLQNLVESVGASRNVVDTKVLIVLPRNLSFEPTATLEETSFQVERLRRQLADVPNISLILEELDLRAHLPSLKPSGNIGADLICKQAKDALSPLPTRFGDSCVSCPLFRHCRTEAVDHRSVSRLGNVVASTCGSITSIDVALDLANGRRAPSNASESAVRDLLSRAASALTLVGRSAS